MRRVGLVFTTAVTLTLLPVSVAYADPSPTSSAGAPRAASTVCTVSDTAATGLTGLAATSDGWAVVTGARTGILNKNERVYLLGADCKKKTTLAFLNNGSRDPQDLAVTADAVWVADIGDPLGERTSVVVWKVPLDGGASTLNRLTYPDGGHPDAEAMLLGSDGLPIIITKGSDAPAQIFQASGPLDAKNTVALKSVGTFAPKKTDTPTKLGAGGVASTTVTGGAVSPDGKKVVLRTLTDAYEWDVADGNIVAAITSDKYRITPLPNEPNGSAISYSADGATFVTLSSVTDSSTPRTLLSYQPAKAGAPSTGGSAGTGGGSASGGGGGSTSWFSKLSFTDLTYIIGVIGVIGLLMIVGGILGIRRSRKQQRAAAKRAARAAELDDWEQPAPDEYDRGYPPVDDRYAVEDPYPPADRRAAGWDYPPEPEPVVDDRYPARPAPRRPEPGGTYSAGGYGAAGDDYDAGYPESYGSGYAAGTTYGSNGAPDDRGAEYGAPRRGQWADEPTTGGTSGRLRATGPGEVPPRQPRTDPRRSAGRTTQGRAVPPNPAQRQNTWADEHEGFGDLRG